MSRLVDPTLCPDCRATLDPSATCRACGLVVRGPLAADLWRVMVEADGLVERLRALSGAPAVATTGPAPVATSALPQFPDSGGPAPARSRRLPAASVPVVLLSLGALCLLVAAVVFVAVTWSLLGLTGRTLVLLGFTAVLSLVAVVLTRKDLRGAAETFWLVVAGMLAVDVLGAQSAGLAGLDALDWRGTGAVLGTTLAALGIGVGAWARRQPVGRLYGVEVVAATGALVVTSTNAWFADNTALGSTIAIPVLATLFVLLRRQVPVAAYGMGGLAIATWLVLLLTGWERAQETVGFGEWWSDVRGWPLLAAAAFAAVVVHAPRAPERARTVAAGLGLLALSVLAVGPDTVGTETRDAVIASAVLVALGLLAAFAPRAWATGAGVLAGLGVLGLGLRLTVGPWEVLSALYPDGSSTVGTHLVQPLGDAAAWTAGVLAVAIAATMLLLLRRLPDRHRAAATRCAGALAPAVLALGGLVLVLQLAPPLWGAVLAAAVGTGIAGGAAWWVRDDLIAGWAGAATTAYLGLLTLWTAAANEVLLAVVTSVAFVALAAVHAHRERSGSTISAGVSAALAALFGAWTLVAWGIQFGADEDARAIALALYAALVGVLAAPVTRRTSSRLTLEATALMVGASAAAYAVDQEASAMALTIVGSAICVVAVVNRDRDVLSWLGAALLGLATVLRVILDVQAPELYTLPAAALLVGVGAWRLHNDRESNSFLVLGSGLTLALLPSLLLALDEPVSLRGALIGAGGVLVLVAGVQLRLAAPFVLGAATTAVLALRHLQPYADAVPRWISLGAVGLGLLVVGVTWEARRRNLETAGRYLAALR